MSVNTLTFQQISSVLSSLVKQATGQTVLTATNTEEFVSVAQIALRADRDAVMNAVSNMVGKTIFSIRPYSAKFTGLDMDSFRWGNMMRKLSIADEDWADDAAYKYPVLYDAGQNPPDGLGGTVDQWLIKKPNILQTNFYGSSIYGDHMTITEDQLESAFAGPEQLGSFLSLLMTNLSNRLELARENIKRGLVANMIGSIYDENQTGRIIHLITEFNALAGTSLDSQTVYDPANFSGFMKWVYSRVASISDLMTEQSTMFQTTINSTPILRHTPVEAQRFYMLASNRHQYDSRVLADAFHDTYLTRADVESVNYWQSIGAPATVKVTPTYTKTDGTVETPNSPVTVDDVFGVIFDRDCLGYTELDRRTISTPVNASGLYRNIWVHCKIRVLQDLSEKAVLLIMD